MLETIAVGWGDLPGSALKLGAQSSRYFEFGENGYEKYMCLLHPNSLQADIVRVVVEARSVDGFIGDPFLQVVFGADGELATTPDLPTALEEDWVRYQFTIVRPQSGVPMGHHLDMFQYSGRGFEVRLFEVHDLGVKGDVDLNGQVDMQDAAIVLGNYAMSGELQVEDGDTNLDGTIDMTDVTNVIDAMDNN